jgi:hypothetical protein
MKECDCSKRDLNEYHPGENRVCWLSCKGGPGLLQMGKNLFQDTWKFINNFCPLVSDKEYNKRLGPGGCEDCNMRDKSYDGISCLVCGCDMSIKAHMATAQCPHPSGSRWPANAYSDNKSNWAPPCGGCGRH